MGRDIAAGIIVVFMALVAMIALFLGAFGGSTTVTYDDAASVPAPTESGGGLVYGRHETGGMNVLGVQIRARDRWLSVGFVAPEECLETGDEGAQIVLTSGACGELPGSGVVEGGGITTDRVEWVIVRVNVSRACFEAISVGDRWPSGLVECQEGRRP